MLIFVLYSVEGERDTFAKFTICCEKCHVNDLPCNQDVGDLHTGVYVADTGLISKIDVDTAKDDPSFLLLFIEGNGESCPNII